MTNKIFIVFICAIGFILPVGVALIGVSLPSLSVSDPGLPDGFKPVGELRVYYAGGG